MHKDKEWADWLIFGPIGLIRAKKIEFFFFAHRRVDNYYDADYLWRLRLVLSLNAV